MPERGLAHGRRRRRRRARRVRGRAAGGGALRGPRARWSTTSRGTRSRRRPRRASTGRTRTGRSTGRATGTTLMNVRSDERNYWKVETLDQLRRGPLGAVRRRARQQPAAARAVRRRRGRRDLGVTIRDLDTDLFPIAGTALQITGADPVIVPSEDGTVEALGESLDEGDSYAGRGVRARADAGRDARGAARRCRSPSRDTPRLGPPLPDEYEPVERLARRLARGQPTTYDVVRAVQRHLRSEYTYGERPPRREFPLPAFLFRDRIGYCQQFSGAMALMLRMLGIPARVAAGFTPGSYNADTKEYRVRDLDAHSWVEVWFDGHRLGAVRPDAVDRAGRLAVERRRSVRVGRRRPNAGEAQDVRDAQASPARRRAAASSERAVARTRRSRAGWRSPRSSLLGGGVARRPARVRALVRRRRARPRRIATSPTLRRALARTGEPRPAAPDAAPARVAARAHGRARRGPLRADAARAALRAARRAGARRGRAARPAARARPRAGAAGAARRARGAAARVV